MANKFSKAAMIEEYTIVDGNALRATALTSSLLADCQARKTVLIVVDNGLDQPLGVRLLGSTARTGTAVLIGSPWPCDSTSLLVINVRETEWMPFMGVQYQASTVPTSGKLTVKVYV